MAKLVGQNQKLASASFANLQFWTESEGYCFMNQKSSNGSILLGLRVLQDGLQVGKGIIARGKG